MSEERYWYKHLINTDPTGAAKVVSITMEWRQGFAGKTECIAPGQYEVLLAYPHPERALLRLKEKGFIKWQT